MLYRLSHQGSPYDNLYETPKEHVVPCEIVNELFLTIRNGNVIWFNLIWNGWGYLCLKLGPHLFSVSPCLQHPPHPLHTHSTLVWNLWMKWYPCLKIQSLIPNSHARAGLSSTETHRPGTSEASTPPLMLTLEPAVCASPKARAGGSQAPRLLPACSVFYMACALWNWFLG